MSFRHTPPKLAQTFVVVADRAQARLFTGTWPDLEDCREVDGMVHPESRLRMHDTVSDRPGRFRTPAGQRTAADPNTDFQHRTTSEFARRIIARLEQGRTNEEFGRWILVAPPVLLGELRREAPPPLAKLLAAEIEKELVHLKPHEILPHVREAIANNRHG